jgi:hypothetical protein
MLMPNYIQNPLSLTSFFKTLTSKIARYPMGNRPEKMPVCDRGCLTRQGNPSHHRAAGCPIRKAEKIKAMNLSGTTNSLLITNIKEESRVTSESHAVNAPATTSTTPATTSMTPAITSTTPTVPPLLGSPKRNGRVEQQFPLDPTLPLYPHRRSSDDNSQSSSGGSEDMDEHENEKRDDGKDNAPETNQAQQVARDAGKKVKQPGKTRPVIFITNKRKRDNAFRKGRERLIKAVHKLGLSTGAYIISYIRELAHNKVKKLIV